MAMTFKKNRIGEVNKNKDGVLMQIIAYRKCSDITVKFLNGTNEERVTTYALFKNGNVKAYIYTTEDEDKDDKWLPVVGYEEYYEVSNKGCIRSLKNKTIRSNGRKLSRGGILLKQATDKKGYKRVALRKDGKSKTFMVHRVVAETFLSNVNNLPMVNHKDENKANNNVENLEWCDNIYNINYGTFRERQKNKMMVYAKPVIVYNSKGEFIKECPSVKEAARFTSCSVSSVTNCCKNRKYYLSSKGYKFKYKEDIIKKKDDKDN